MSAEMFTSREVCFVAGGEKRPLNANTLQLWEHRGLIKLECAGLIPGWRRFSIGDLLRACSLKALIDFGIHGKGIRGPLVERMAKALESALSEGGDKPPRYLVSLGGDPLEFSDLQEALSAACGKDRRASCAFIVDVEKLGEALSERLKAVRAKGGEGK